MTSGCVCLTHRCSSRPNWSSGLYWNLLGSIAHIENRWVGPNGIFQTKLVSFELNCNNLDLLVDFNWALLSPSTSIWYLLTFLDLVSPSVPFWDYW